MADYSTLKAAIQAVIRTNGNEEITGATLQQSLLTMIDSLGAGYQFMGVASTSTNPGTPDQNGFYLAFDAGTYSNFGGTSLDNGQVGVFSYNGSWTYTVKTIAQDVSWGNIGGTLSDQTDLQNALDEIASAAENTVKYTSQSLTDAQKTQARTNLGAASETDLNQLGQEVNGRQATEEEIAATDTQTKKHLKYDGTIIAGSAVESVVRTYPAVEGGIYKIDGRVGSIADTCLAVFLDSSNVALAHFNDTTGTGTPYQNVEVIAPTGAVTLKVAGNTGAANPYNTKVVLVTEAVVGVQQKITTLTEYVGDGGEEESITQSAIYNSSYVSNETGELLSGTVGSKTYEFRGIFPGKTYKLTGRVGANTSTCLVAYYDENGNFISCEIPSTGTAQVYEDYVATIPDGCAMLRILGYFPTSPGTVIPAVKVSYIVTNVLDELVKETFNGKSICKNYGKSIVVLGGSHSVRDESESAKDIWREKLGLSVYSAGVGSCGITAGITMYGWTNGTDTYYTRGGYNDAVGSRVWDDYGYLSGLTITARSDSSITLSNGVTYSRDTGKDYYNNSQTKVSRLLSKDGLNKKIYLVWLSTNDYNQNLALGAFSDYTEVDNYDATKIWSDTSHIGTICGGFNFIVKTIRENNPTAEIYVFSSIRYFSSGARGYDPFTTDANASGKNFYEYQEEILKAAQAAGCAVLDQFLLQGVGISNYTAFYQSDHLHLNEAGYKRIGWIQTDFLANGK